MKCPKCGADNPDKTWQCLCGYFFLPGDQTSRHQESGKSEQSADFQSVSPAVLSEEQSSQPVSPLSEPVHKNIDERFAFHGDGSTLFSIYLATVIFSIVTLGIYYFWGKAKVRRYVYGQSSFAGDRFDYHGTGEELLWGSLKAGLLIGGISLIYRLVTSTLQSVSGAVLATLLFYAALAIVVPVAIVGTQRYRLSRTSWRGIRFSFAGHASDLLRQYLRDMVLVVLTLGLFWPFFQNRLRTFLVRNSYFGSKSFSYKGEGWDLFFMFLKMILLAIPTLGLYWYWYTAAKHRYYWEHTSFGDAHFRSNMQGWELAKLRLSNLLLVVFTFGLGYPWAVARSARFQLECLSCYGAVDLDEVFQQARAATATGEGLVEMLDAGILDIDFGF